MAALILPGENASVKALVVLAECLSVCCRLRPVAGYAMASLRQRSAALVAGGSGRFCYQIAEHLGVTLFKFMAGTLSAPLGFLPTLAFPFITNEWMCRGGGGVRPLLHRSFTVGKWLAGGGRAQSHVAVWTSICCDIKPENFLFKHVTSFLFYCSCAKKSSSRRIRVDMLLSNMWYSSFTRL